MELDQKTFKELIYRQRDLIWQVCSSYRMSAAWTTEDAFHEVLCDLWRGIGTFDQRSSESTWVYRIAINT
ncbi:MAG: RNA polymerase subunit sigma-70, partial [Bacteroidales bacterium]|nr:RNA polymerase subunit sigma-70 [Bacteroidales bacterium]